MSYLRRHDHLRSTVTGKEYPIPVADPDGSKMRATVAQLMADNKQVTDAAEQRNQRPLTPRERIEGRVHVPVVQPVKLTGQPGAPDPNSNPFASVLADAQRVARTAMLPQDRAAAARRVETYQAKYDAWAGNRQVEKVAEQVVADPKRQEALTHARVELDVLTVRGDVSESHIQSARARLDALTACTIDPDTYYAQTEAAEGQLAAERHSAAKALELQARELRQQARAIRAGDPPAAPTEPQATEAPNA